MPPNWPDAQPPAPAAPAPTLVTIGDIACTSDQVITPSGARPIGQVTWTFTDMTRTTRGIPTWAVVCAVVFFIFCFLGLLFLLARSAPALTPPGRPPRAKG